MFNKRAKRRRGKAVDEGFDAGHPMAAVMRSLQPADVEMDREARERLMGHLFSVQRRMARGKHGRGRAGWKAAMTAGVAAAAVVAVALAIMVPGSEKPEPARHFASASGLLGNVEVMPPHGEWRAVTEGENLEVGASVRTGEGSFATMVFPDGSIMRITDGSEARIKGLDAQSVLLEHVRGGTYHRVHKGTRYTVINQDVSSRALGTAFNVDNRMQGDLEILTVQSAVEVSIGEHQPITVGEGEVMVVSLSEDKKAVKQQVSRERLAEGRLYANVRQDAQEGYSTGIYEQVDVEPEETPEEESDDPGEASPVISLEGNATDAGVSLKWSWGADQEGVFHELVVLRSGSCKPVYPDDEIARYSDVSIRTASDDSVTGGLTYQYRLAARSGYGSVTYSNTVVINVPVPKPEPKPASISLSASPSANGITLEWSVSGVTNFNGFVIERMVEKAPKASETPAGSVYVTRIDSNNVFYTYLDGDAAPKHTYTYRVGLVVEGAVMIYSNRATVEVP
ncbi:MAG: FecR family protein [Actinobacteria bacterium]|nr:FecR family protein [Actinomycetota bacterium]